MEKARRIKKKKPSRSKLKKEDQRGEGRPATKKWLHQPFLHYFLIAVIAILAYSNTFQSPFQWDENDFIVRNPIVKNLEYFLTPSRAKEFDPDLYISLKTRFMGYLTFALNYKVHGFDVLGYHLFNLTIHILNAILVYLFTLLTFKTPFLRGSPIGKNPNLIALFSSLLFVSHPIQTEAVTYIYQRLASLVTFFYLLSLVFYIQWRLKSEEKELSHFHSTTLYALSLLSAVLAMKTKENSFTLPFCLTVYEFFFFTGPKKIRVIRLIPFLLTFAIIPLTLIGMDKSFGEIITHILDPSSLVIKTVSEEAYLFTQFRVILTYLRLLFLPIHQNLDYNYPVYPTFLTLQVFLPFLFHLTLLGLAVYLFHRSQSTSPHWRFISFGILWFFITLSVESSVIPQQVMMDEYRVYLPSVGMFIAIVTTVFLLPEKLKVKFPKLEKQILWFFIFAVALLSVLTYSRNIVWKDVVSMWKDVAEKSPGNPRAHYNLGLAYAERGRLDEAKKEFEKALELDPSHAKARNNLGLIYDQQGRSEDAIREFHLALKLNPDNADVHYNLGLIYGRQGRLNDAIMEFQISLKINPNDASAHNNLGVLFGQQGRLDDAIREFQAALKIDPDHTKARNNLTRAILR